MKILQLCTKPPFPPIDGGAFGMNGITQGLLDLPIIDLKVLAINTPKHPVLDDKIPEDYKIRTKFESYFVNTSVSIFKLLRSIICNQSYNVTRFYSKEFDDHLYEVLQKQRYDVVQLEGLYAAPYIETIRRFSNAAIVMRAHNIEYLIWETRLAQTKNILKKIGIFEITRRLKNYEIKTLNTVDGILTVSEKERRLIKNLGITTPSINVPVLIKIDETPSQNTNPLPLCYIGAMDWSPNQEGLLWFLKDIWPKILLKFPEIKFIIAGRKSDEFFKGQTFKNVTILGEVDNSKEFLASNGIMLIPVLSGGGIRIKLIEGMAMAKTIICTTMGADGIDCTNNHDVFIADSADEFINAIQSSISNPETYKKIGQNALETAKKQFDRKKLINDLFLFYERLIS